ncbi:hypothetical protein Tco_1132247 [Tanacetum coccineum]|uniref:Uncharacterized protein n=1 Tax=Tanacetum coccineum TaxID=301880 RepID=A0ABQ5JBC0_9ASTR
MPFVLEVYLVRYSLQLVRETLADPPCYVDVDGEHLDWIWTKHPFKHAPTSPTTPIDHHHLIESSSMVLDRWLGEYIASAPLTPLVKLRGGIHPIAVGIVWRRLVSKVGTIMLGYSLDGLQFGVEVSGGDYITGNTPYGHAKGCNRAWYLDDGTIVGDTLVVRKVLELIIEDGPRCGLHLNVDKTEFFGQKKTLEADLKVFFLNISRPMHDVKLLGGPASVDFDFSSELVMKRVAKTIELMDAVARINDPQCEFSFDVAIRSTLERIVTASGLGFGYWQWRSAGLQTKLLRHTGIVASGPTFNGALCVFNTSMETDILSNTKGLFEGYVWPVCLGLEKDFWEAPSGWIWVSLLSICGLVSFFRRLVSSGIAVATYNEGATDFKETPAYKESIQSRDLLEEPDRHKVLIF